MRPFPFFLRLLSNIFTYCIIKTDGISKIKITTNVDVTGDEQVEIWDIRILNSVDMDLYRENLGYSESYKKILIW